MRHWPMIILAVLAGGCSSIRTVDLAPGNPQGYVVVYQPSHQTDTGRDFNEAAVCNAIADAAMDAATDGLRVWKVWSYGVDTVHHDRQGSNTKVEHTSAVDSLGRMSGYAYELTIANSLNPDIFISLHNNGATNRNAVWGYYHEGDAMEPANRELAALLTTAISKATGMEDRGIHGDSSPNRNDYRCAATGKLAFYSLDEHVNRAPIRVLMEIGDNAVSREILTNPASQKAIGAAIQRTLEAWLAD